MVDPKPQSAIDPAWFQALEALYHEVAELSPEERERVIQARTAMDPAARRRLLQMFAAVDTPAFTRPLAEAIVAQSGASGGLVGATLGVYRLTEFRGEGGFGEVYVAEQSAPIKRRVAVKVLREHIATSMRRFELEVGTLALMEHPAIARIYDAGMAPIEMTIDGAREQLGERYFLAMEVVDGLPLHEFAEARRLGTVERLELFACVVDGVLHAHQKGVIHRDLKPANVLVAEVDGRAMPKIIDFGIARAVDEASRLIAVSATRDAAGTPRYMSPEQGHRDHARDVDSRSDLYSLGVMLRELLSTSDASDRIAHAPATPRWMRSDLEAIIAKATAQLPNDRYATAADLATDVRRLIKAEPLLARPASNRYRLRRWARRQWLGAVIATVLVLGSLLGIAGVLRGAVVAREEAGRADRINDFLREVLTSVHPERRGASVEFATVLNDATRLAGERFADYPLAEADVRAVLAEVNENLGRRADALREAQRVEALRLAELGVAHTETIDATLAIGRAYLGSQMFDELDELCSRLGPLVRERYGPHDPRLVQLEVLRARVMGGRGDELAAVQHIRALREQSEAHGTLGPENRSLLLREELSLLRRASTGLPPAASDRPIDLDELLRLTSALYDAEVAVSGPDGVPALTAQAALAKCYWQVGRFGEARKQADDLLERTEQRFSDAHRLRLDGRRIVFWHALSLGNFEEACRNCELVATSLQAVTEPKHLERVSMEVDLPRYYNMAGKYARGEESARMIAERLQSFGGNYARMAYAPLTHRARALSKLGRYDEATELFNALVADSPNWDWKTDQARLMSFYAAHLAAIGKHDEANAAIERSLAILPDPARGTYRDFAGDRLPMFVEVAESSGDLAQAEAYRKMIEKIYSENRLR